MSHRDRPNSIPSPWRHADLFSSAAATPKRGSRTHKNNRHEIIIMWSGSKGAEEGAADEEDDTLVATRSSLNHLYLLYLIKHN